MSVMASNARAAQAEREVVLSAKFKSAVVVPETPTVFAALESKLTVVNFMESSANYDESRYRIMQLQHHNKNFTPSFISCVDLHAVLIFGKPFEVATNFREHSLDHGQFFIYDFIDYAADYISRQSDFGKCVLFRRVFIRRPVFEYVKMILQAAVEKKETRNPLNYFIMCSVMFPGCVNKFAFNMVPMMATTTDLPGLEFLVPIVFSSPGRHPIRHDSVADLMFRFILITYDNFKAKAMASTTKGRFYDAFLKKTYKCVYVALNKLDIRFPLKIPSERKMYVVTMEEMLKAMAKTKESKSLVFVASVIFSNIKLKLFELPNGKRLVQYGPGCQCVTFKDAMLVPDTTPYKRVKYFHVYEFYVVYRFLALFDLNKEANKQLLHRFDLDEMFQIFIMSLAAHHEYVQVIVMYEHFYPRIESETVKLCFDLNLLLAQRMMGKYIGFVDQILATIDCCMPITDPEIGSRLVKFDKDFRFDNVVKWIGGKEGGVWCLLLLREVLCAVAASRQWKGIEDIAIHLLVLSQCDIDVFYSSQKLAAMVIDSIPSEKLKEVFQENWLENILTTEMLDIVQKKLLEDHEDLFVISHTPKAKKRTADRDKNAGKTKKKKKVRRSGESKHSEEEDFRKAFSEALKGKNAEESVNKVPSIDKEKEIERKTPGTGDVAESAIKPEQDDVKADQESFKESELKMEPETEPEHKPQTKSQPDPIYLRGTDAFWVIAARIYRPKKKVNTANTVLEYVRKNSAAIQKLLTPEQEEPVEVVEEVEKIVEPEVVATATVPASPENFLSPESPENTGRGQTITREIPRDRKEKMAVEPNVADVLDEVADENSEEKILLAERNDLVNAVSRLNFDPEDKVPNDDALEGEEDDVVAVEEARTSKNTREGSAEQEDQEVIIMEDKTRTSARRRPREVTKNPEGITDMMENIPMAALENKMNAAATPEDHSVQMHVAATEETTKSESTAEASVELKTQPEDVETMRTEGMVKPEGVTLTSKEKEAAKIPKEPILPEDVTMASEGQVPADFATRPVEDTARPSAEGALKDSDKPAALSTGPVDEPAPSEMGTLATDVAMEDVNPTNSS